MNNIYSDFLKNNFPKTSILENPIHLKFYKYIYKADICTEVSFSKLSNNTVISTLLERFIDILYRFLIIIPLNDIYSSSFYMRLITENILKIVYSFYYTNKTLDDIDNIKYRYLNSGIKDKYNSDLYIKSNVDKLFSFYAKYSNEVHNKNYIANITDMESLIKSESSLLGDIFQDFCNIIDIYNRILIYNFKIYNTDLNTSQKLRLLNILDRKDKEKFINFINNANKSS